MRLFDRLPQEDVVQLNRYLNNYSDGGYIDLSRMPYFLRYWEQNKERFYKAFGENFILKKEIYFEKRSEVLEKEMDHAIHWNDSIIQMFCYKFKEKVDLMFGKCPEVSNLKLFVDNNYMLVNNEYYGNSFSIPKEFTKNNRPLQINSGCKVVKMLGKICDAIDFKYGHYVCPDCGRIMGADEVVKSCPSCGGKAEYKDGYESFRRAHSLVLNQKKIKGNLCLSIHPLDFLTMSDNDCGWTSCMCWMEEHGEYRLGTIEMMNSDSVVIAYVEASEPMSVCGGEWSNKRWRQLYVITPELILGNKQYPYWSDELQGVTIRWIRELMTPVIGYGPYAEETSIIINESKNWIDGEKLVYFDLSSDFMYNDIYDDRLAYVASTRFEDQDRYYHNFSGPAVCCQCGDQIPYETVDPQMVLCHACDGHWQCERCGDWHSEYDESYLVGDMLYCDWCYHHELEECELCGEKGEQLNHIFIQVTETNNREIIEDFNYNYYISMCDCCMEDPESYEADYGPIYDVIDMWGRRRKAFDIKNISDRGLQSGEMGISIIEFLKSMREMSSDEDRLALIRKNSF